MELSNSIQKNEWDLIIEPVEREKNTGKIWGAIESFFHVCETLKMS